MLLHYLSDERSSPIEVKIFRSELEIHETIFRKEVTLLLSAAVPYDQAEEMRGNRNRPAWTNTAVERVLADYMGTSNIS